MGKVCTWPTRPANDFRALSALALPGGLFRRLCRVIFPWRLCRVAFAVARVGFRGCPR
jgi:hypothetical protein